MSDTDFGNLAVGVGTLMVAGAIAQRISKPSKNGLFGEPTKMQHRAKPYSHKMKWGF